MARKLKIWNGRGHGSEYQNKHIYVAAYSQKHAAELVSIACYGKDHPDLISLNEIRNYYNAGAWGNSMNGIEPVEPCVYYTEGYSDQEPKRIV